MNHLGCHNAFVVSLWILWGFTFFGCVHGEKTTISHDVMWDVFVTTTRNVRFHISQAQTPCHAIFAMLSWHYVINRWCPRVDRRCHHWPYLSWFDFVGCFFSWGCCNNHDSSKGWSLFAIGSQWTCFFF